MTQSRNINKPKITKICPICNKEFIVLYARRQRLYCSVACSHIGLKSVKHWWHPKSEFKVGHKHSEESKLKMSINSKGKGGLRGKKHPMWKGRKYKRYIHTTWTKTYKKWRKAVFKRDEYTCMECNKHGGILNAHHIIPWVDSKKHRFLVYNGVTLCKKCHKQVHLDIRTMAKAEKLFYKNNEENVATT